MLAASFSYSGNVVVFFFFQAEDGIRDADVTGVQRVLFRSEDAYVGVLETALARRGRVFVVFGVIAVSGAALLPFVGRDFFPEVDTGQFRLHVRAQIGRASCRERV